MHLEGRLSIGELSRRSGVKDVTIRYYERINLMPSPPRTENNYRAYKWEHLYRLRFIRRCRDLGFTLDQLRDLLSLSTQPGLRCAAVDHIAESHLEEIERKVADLQRLAIELRRIKMSCAGRGRIGNCRILQALSSATKAAGPDATL
jgi:DNA-binding transcriptional MerR regulator